MADVTPDKMAKSRDYRAMESDWTLVSAILGGIETMRKGREAYLPRFAYEDDENYNRRLGNSRFTNIYEDIVSGLASKPFDKETKVVDVEKAPKPFQDAVEDIDRSGTHLNIFAQDLFFHALNYAVDWIFVDHTVVPQGSTLADVRRMGARPYWLRVPATAMLDVRSAMVDGSEQFIYAKMDETFTEIDNKGDEVTVPCVRELIRDKLPDDSYGPARFEIWQKRAAATGGAEEWRMTAFGPISIGVIALVPLPIGRRKPGTWQFRPPLRAVAELQVEHYQDETNLKAARVQGCFPMYAGNGITPPLDEQGKPKKAPIGPSAVLYSPMNDQGQHGEWQVLEIAATSLTFNSNELDKTEAKMREIGRMPLVAGTAGITQVAAAYASKKASSAAQVWAFLLKDALERAFTFTALWLDESYEPEVFVHTDFAIEVGSDKDSETLLGMRKEGILSRRTLWGEMQRRSVLSPEFDAEKEEKLLLQEAPSDGEDEIDGAVTPRPDQKEPAEEAEEGAEA